MKSILKISAEHQVHIDDNNLTIMRTAIDDRKKVNGEENKNYGKRMKPVVVGYYSYWDQVFKYLISDQISCDEPKSFADVLVTLETHTIDKTVLVAFKELETRLREKSEEADKATRKLEKVMKALDESGMKIKKGKLVKIELNS